MAIIYCIRHLISGMCYVGQTIQPIKKRWKHHRNSDGCSYIHRAIKKYGTEAFAWEILEVCEKENADARECHWIANLDSVAPNGYNLQTGGGSKHTVSAETREKLSKAGKGRKHTEEAKRKMSEALRGRKRSPEQIQKMSESKKGEKPSAETRQKQSEAKKGEKNYFYGKTHSLVSRQKISDANKLHHLWDNWREICEMYKKCGNYCHVADTFGGSQQTIRRIVMAHSANEGVKRRRRHKQNPVQLYLFEK